ncbi:MAG TPA: DUF222 domain-containing protein, partial [Acidimicrobiales bacterium]|nr:DUF222 domain-containing protein [Acidimicrobiales bacterium]
MTSTPVLKGKRTSGRPAGDGLRVRLEGATSILSDLVAGLEPARLTGADAKELYEGFVRAERFCVAAKTLLAPRIEATSVWAEEGHANAASLLAAVEGVPVGQARSTLELGRHLDQLPDTAEAIREGKLSRPTAAEVIGAALLDPESEAELLAGAEELPHHQMKERCRRSRATSARHDPVAATQRIYAEREFISWSDADGAFCYRGRDTADRGAQILHQIDAVARRLRRQRRADHRRASGGTPDDAGRYAEPEKACRADAFYALVTRSGTGTGGSEKAGTAKPGGPSSGSAKPGAPKSRAAGTHTSPTPKAGPGSRPSPDPDVDPDTLEVDLDADTDTDAAAEELADGWSLIDRPPTCSVNVRVDLAALLRGETHPGEICEIDGQGPIPPKMARDMANDAFLRFIFCESGDIRSIYHFGRTINKALRTALVHRDRICVVPGCGVG